MIASALPLRSDERLALQVAGGNDAAFTVIYRRYESSLFGYCRSITRNPDDAGDALQNAMLKALVALRREERKAPLRPWLFRIVHNEAVNQVTRRPAVAPVVESHHDAVAGADDQAAGRERIAELVEDLRDLPLRQRAALVMRELSGLEYDEIALALDVSGNNARQLVHSARTSMKDRREGRALPCASVREMVLYADARRLRRRSVRSHMRTCHGCRAFAAADPRQDAARAAGVGPWSPIAGGGLLDGLFRIFSASGSAVVGSTVTKTATAAVIFAAGAGVADATRHPVDPSPRIAQRSTSTPSAPKGAGAAATASAVSPTAALAAPPAKVVLAAATVAAGPPGARRTTTGTTAERSRQATVGAHRAQPRARDHPERDDDRGSREPGGDRQHWQPGGGGPRPEARSDVGLGQPSDGSGGDDRSQQPDGQRFAQQQQAPTQPPPEHTR